MLTKAAKYVRDDHEARLPDGTELMPSTQAVYAMLIGYSIECALKGLWIKAGNKIVKDGGYVGVKGVGDHEVGQLAQLVDPSLSAVELDVLNRLSAFIRFAGRYPIPKTAQEMTPVSVPGRGKQAKSFFSKEDFGTAERLLD
jgi:hypothetical protein